MILHNVMWESRPLPKIARKPPSPLSAQGGLLLSALCCRACKTPQLREFPNQPSASFLPSFLPSSPCLEPDRPGKHSRAVRPAFAKQLRIWGLFYLLFIPPLVCPQVFPVLRGVILWMREAGHRQFFCSLLDIPGCKIMLI